MGITCCGNCAEFQQNKKLIKNEWEGICKKKKIFRNYESSSCDLLREWVIN